MQILGYRQGPVPAALLGDAVMGEHFTGFSGERRQRRNTLAALAP